MPTSVHKFVIMGVQGSGKGTQAALLAGDFDLVHLSVGDTFRWHVQHHTKLGAQVRRIMAAGELVDDELVESVVRDRLAMHDWNYGFVLDGFPRNARQAEFFLESYDIDGVINLHLPDEVVHERVLARRLCAGCGLDWNLLAHRPKVADVCDMCGSALLVRADDNPEALAVRLKAYHDKTAPVLALFQRKEFVATFDATRSVDEIQADIRERFGLVRCVDASGDRRESDRLRRVRTSRRASRRGRAVAGAGCRRRAGQGGGDVGQPVRLGVPAWVTAVRPHRRAPDPGVPHRWARTSRAGSKRSAPMSRTCDRATRCSATTCRARAASPSTPWHRRRRSH